MKKCPNCGASVSDNDRHCAYCKTEIDREKTAYNTINDYGTRVKKSIDDIHDDGAFVYSVIGFIFPLIGLIIYLAWNNTKPKNAKAAGVGALVGVIVQLFFGLSFFSFFFRIFNQFPFFGF